jgi:hypothetical protein
LSEKSKTARGQCVGEKSTGAVIHSFANMDCYEPGTREASQETYRQESPFPCATQCIRGVWILQFHLLVSHYTDTHIYVFSLALLVVVRLFLDTQKQISDPPLYPLRITKRRTPVRVVGIAHYRDSIYCNTWTRNVTPFTAKRDSENIIDCKTRRVTWFLNDVCFHVINSLLFTAKRDSIPSGEY